MKKLKNFQKFALSAEQASKVRGGIACHFTSSTGATLIVEYETAEDALDICGIIESCAGCF